MYFSRFTLRQFLLQATSSCYFLCTWVHLRPDSYLANSFSEKETKTPRGSPSRCLCVVEQTQFFFFLFLMKLPCQGQWLDRNWQELCCHLEELHITQHHTRWRSQDCFTYSSQHTGAVQDHYRAIASVWYDCVKQKYDKRLRVDLLF